MIYLEMDLFLVCFVLSYACLGACLVTLVLRRQVSALLLNMVGILLSFVSAWAQGQVVDSLVLLQHSEYKNIILELIRRTDAPVIASLLIGTVFLIMNVFFVARNKGRAHTPSQPLQKTHEPEHSEAWRKLFSDGPRDGKSIQ